MSGATAGGPREVAVVRFGAVHAHAVSRAEAIELIVERAKSGTGGFVLTPNVDHVSLSTRNSEVALAYSRCFLSLADGMPLVLLSRLLRLPLREKVSGSDLFEPLMARCAREGLPVFFVGATTEPCEAAARKLQIEYPHDTAGWPRLVSLRSRGRPRPGGHRASPGPRLRSPAGRCLSPTSQTDDALTFL
jgi:UDP-N-acetyl-D-mannosaminuronic acid transferase (WecB/TagA/CpsF family)